MSKARLFGCAGLIVSAASGGAWAQETAPATGPDAIAIEEIVVTAQKRAENLQKVPVAVSALSSDQIERQNLHNVNDIASQVPSFQVTTPYSDAVPIFALRGVSSVDNSQNQSSPVALYVDEVYKGLPVFTSLQVFDLERIEVLRGPQGTLFGKNTTGGAVSLHSRRPDLDGGLSGYLTLGYGRFDRREAMGGVNLPLVDDRLAARIAFTLTKADGFVENRLPDIRDQGDIDDWAVRLSLAFRPSDRAEFLLRYTHGESTPDSGPGAMADDIGVGGVGLPFVETGYTRAGLGFFENEADSPGRVRIRNDSIALTANVDVSDAATLTSVSSYDRGRWFNSEDPDGSPFRLLDTDFFSRGEAYAQDLRLASSGEGPLKWLVGAYYYRDRVDLSTTIRYFYGFPDVDHDGVSDCLQGLTRGCATSNALRQVRESVALYSQTSYTLDSGLTLTAGLRYTHDDNRLDSYLAVVDYLDPATGQSVRLGATIEAPPVDRLKSENLSGKLGVSYETDGGTLLYGNISRGYRGGAFNGQAFNSPEEVTTAKPERLDAIDVGAKMQAFDRRLRLNVAAFYYDYRNQQFLDLASSEGAVLQILYNAPKSRLFGGEVELVARPTEALTVRFGLSYLNAKYREITLLDTTTLTPTDLSGNRIVLSPEFTIAGGVDWTIVETSAGSLSLHTDSRFTSKHYFNAFNTPTATENGFTVHDARLTFETADGKVQVAGWIKNIFNETYKVYIQDLSSLANFTYRPRSRPREFGVQLSYRF